MKQSVTINQLTTGNTFHVRGRVFFSQVSRKTTDSERELLNTGKKHKITKNYTSMSIYDARVLIENPQEPTLEDIYGLEHLYKSNKYSGKCFTAMNKLDFIPSIYVINKTEKDTTYDTIQLTDELLRGTDVTLILCVCENGKNKSDKVVALSSVLINQPKFKCYKPKNN